MLTRANLRPLRVAGVCKTFWGTTARPMRPGPSYPYPHYPWYTKITKARKILVRVLLSVPEIFSYFLSRTHLLNTFCVRKILLSGPRTTCMRKRANHHKKLCHDSFSSNILTLLWQKSWMYTITMWAGSDLLTWLRRILVKWSFFDTVLLKYM